MLSIIIDDSEIKKAGLQFESFWNSTVSTLFQRMATEARDAVRIEVFSGEILRTGKGRPKAQKSRYYRDMFLAETKTLEDGTLWGALHPKNIGADNRAPSGYEFQSGGFLKNLMGNKTVKAQRGSTLRVPTGKAGSSELTAKGSLRRGIIIGGKSQYFTIKKGSGTYPKAFEKNLANNNNVLLFRRDHSVLGGKEVQNIQLIGIFYAEAKYDKLPQYKLQKIESIAQQFFGGGGKFETEMRKQITSYFK